MADRAAVITGLGAFTPPRVVTNDELAQRIDSSDEWIRTRTGIEQRHYVQEGVSTSDLAAESGRRALKNAGMDTVGFVVVATSSPDRICPATAPTVASKIGLVDVPAMDVAAVCSGFMYALQTGVGVIMGGVADSVLVIASETPSLFLDDDRNAVIFGDGSGAVVLRAGERTDPGAVLAWDGGSDGSLADMITVRGIGSEHRAHKRALTADDLSFRMQGKTVFPHAVRRMVESSQAALKKTGWSTADIDTFVGHQANKRINEAVAELLEIPKERAVINIQNVGNTSSASIPLALVESMCDGLLNTGDRVLLTAFGGGATWASATLVWPELKMPEMYDQPTEEHGK
ncbi:beta-ketoacyl-ACP synthase III [Segniliparus rugosus]|nr:beta-ketoacyl-ACP synthase III [Segniliparus rugosus]